MASECTGNLSSTKQYVFVYGTLKRGQPNFPFLSDKENGNATFVSCGRTVEKFPLLIATRFTLPFLINLPGTGNQIRGEIFEVDSKMMASLDDFEDYPEMYNRCEKLIKVYDNDEQTDGKLNEASSLQPSRSSSDRTMKCWLYVLENYPKEILEDRELLENYDAYTQHVVYKLQEDGATANNIYEELLNDCKFRALNKESSANIKKMASECTGNLSSTKQYVFVYGTLKRGQPNFPFLSDKENGSATFVSCGRTVEKFPLLIATRFTLPFLINLPGTGNQIRGEIFEVDSKMMASLDDFEDYPEMYNRCEKLIKVYDNDEQTDGKLNEASSLQPSRSSSDRTMKCWLYVLENYPKDILEDRELLENYDAYTQHVLYEHGATANNIYEVLLNDCKFRALNKESLHQSHKGNENISSNADTLLSQMDEVQVSLMKEECILIDNKDKKIGSATKKDCHLLSNINKDMLHRAFSVFLFNTKGELLLQQRSLEKITFPDHWTNTCCSHPLNFDAELDETEAIGVKRAAQRKLKHELGIEPSQVPLEAFNYLTRIHYKSPNVPYDGVFGEHEIDYILFIKKDVDVHQNENEVKDYKYVTKNDVCDIIEHSTKDDLLITPWFKLIAEAFLPKWWDNLDSLDKVKEQDKIHNMC